MRRIIYILVLICFTQFAKGQVYQSMPQYGYGPVKRMDFDSSLTIPTVCGVPTLKTYITKKAAIAYDSCNQRFYYYDPKLLGWYIITGGGGGSVDTSSLSNRIDARVKYIDTASMLSPYLRKIDTTEKFINRIEQVNGWDSIRYFIGDTSYKVRTGMDTSRVLIAQVHNATGTTLTRGTAVYLSGANGDVASVKRANNKADSTSARTLGLVREDIAAGGIGYVITRGQITKLNLGSFTEGDFLYLDSIDGQITKTKPQAPYHYVQIGIVERANNGNGLAYLNPMNGFETDEIHDIKLTNVLNNEILVYSDTQKVWKNKSVYSVVDTTKLSARIDERVKYSDTSVFLRDADSSLYQTKFRSDTMRTNVYSALNGKQSTTLNSYSLIGNNTNASAIGAAQTFKDSSGTYSGTITFSGTAPSGTTNHTFRYTQLGKMCILNINLSYTTAASCLSVTLTLPPYCATPADPAGMTDNGQFIYPGYGMTWSTKSIPSTTGLNSARTAWMRKNSSGVYEMVIFNYSSGSTIFLSGTVIYWTN